jgi:DNA-binding MurR/RpiR family transcriptional regulator
VKETRSDANPSVALKLRDAMPSLTPSERKVARALLANYPVAGLGTVAELAKLANVSHPTVLRLLTRIEFPSYGDFQRALRDELDERLASVSADFLPDAGAAGDGVGATLQAAIANLTADAESVTAGEIEAVAHALAQARRVFFSGGTTSQAVAHYLFLQLDLVRPGCRFVGPAASPAWADLADLGQRDVLVLFDYRGYEANTLEIARWARSRGARVVLFTDPWLSPITGLAAHLVVTRCESPTPFDTLVPAVALAEAVAADVARQLGDKVEARLAVMERLLAAPTCRLVEGAQEGEQG